MNPRINSLIGAISVFVGVVLFIVLASRSGVTSTFESNVRLSSWLLITVSLLTQTWRAGPLPKPRFIWVSLAGFIPLALWLLLPSKAVRPSLGFPIGVSQEELRDLVNAFHSAMESYFRHQCIGFSLVLIGLGFNQMLTSVLGRLNHSIHSDTVATRHHL